MNKTANNPTLSDLTLSNVVLNNPNFVNQILENQAGTYEWSSTLKHADIQVNETVAKGVTNKGNWNMILLEPSFTAKGVTKVTLKILKLSQVKDQ